MKGIISQFEIQVTRGVKGANEKEKKNYIPKVTHWISTITLNNAKSKNNADYKCKDQLDHTNIWLIQLLKCIIISGSLRTLRIALVKLGSATFQRYWNVSSANLESYTQEKSLSKLVSNSVICKVIYFSSNVLLLLQG